MKITHKVSVEKDFIDDIVCNWCGKSCFVSSKDYGPNGLIEVRVEGGYGSKKIGDGDALTFSLCESCVVKIVMEFKIPPEFDSTHGGTLQQWMMEREMAPS